MFQKLTKNLRFRALAGPVPQEDIKRFQAIIKSTDFRQSRLYNYKFQIDEKQKRVFRFIQGRRHLLICQMEFGPDKISLHCIKGHYSYSAL